MRFPYLSVGVFVLSVAAAVVASYVSSTSCAFGFGGFQCNGMAGEVAGLLFGWSVLAVVVIPLSFVVALWRVVRWRSAQRKRE
ncbi:MAG TPA: hypothetical protein VFS95_13405 [Telluria sp.]|nr:hypothetical protein [Telluria sp.]